MARFNQRLAAGVGVFAAFLLLAGSATVAVADPGRSHSDRVNSSDRGNGSGNGRGGSQRGDDDRAGNGRGGSKRDDHDRGGNGRGGSQRGDDDRGGNGDSGKRAVGGDELNGDVDPGSIESPQVRVGSGRVDVAGDAELAPSIASGTEDSGASASRTSGSGPSLFGGTGAPSASGSDHAGAPNARFSPPQVTLGNGRTPGTHRREPKPQWQAPAPQPVPAAPPPPSPPPAPAAPPPWVNRNPTPPVLTQQLGVSAATDWSNPLWGLAGLLLIPVAGAALGYRQARAAHAAERLRRS